LAETEVFAFAIAIATLALHGGIAFDGVGVSQTVFDPALAGIGNAAVIDITLPAPGLSSHTH